MTIQTAPSPGRRSARGRIYRHLYETRDFCSRQQLAEECGVSMPTLYQNLSELMDDGLVRCSGEDRSTGGRRAQGLEIVPDARIAVGISVTEHHLRLSAADLRMEELAYRSMPFDIVSRLPDGKPLLAVQLESFLDDYRLDRNRLLGVGISLPGLISRDGKRILMAPTLGLRDVSTAPLTRGIPYPTQIENDGTASGHAEYLATNEKRIIAYFSLENGVGGAVVMPQGRSYAGTNSRSGEFGHICVEPGGRRCSCGKQGCLEAYCSPRRIREELGLSVPEFFLGVEEHDPECETMLFDMLRHLATAINCVRMTLDCDVVLGGYLTEFLQPYLSALKKYVLAGNPFDQDGSFLRLSRLRRHIAPLGAALHFVQAFLSSIN